MDSLKTVQKKLLPSPSGLIKQLVSLVTKRSSCYNNGTAAAAPSATKEKEDTTKQEGSKSRKNKRQKVAPEGCFWVCVGAEKQRFVIKTEYVNHPLFKMLLEDAESEYGFDDIEGPIKLPCEVNLFFKVLAEMECGDADSDGEGAGTGFVCSPVWSPRRCNRNKVYEPLKPSPLLKMNSF